VTAVAPAAPTVPSGAAPRSPADWWRSLRPWAKWLSAAAAALLGINAALAGLATVTGGSGPGGPRSSSYATSGHGMAALADLVADDGHPVRRLRTSLDRAGLDPGGTLVLADAAGGTRAELEALVVFVEGGGRLVVAGEGADRVVDRLTGSGPERGGARATPALPLAPVPEVAGVDRVVSGGVGSFVTDHAGATLPVLWSRRGTLAVVATVGAGRVVALADATPWHNRLLGEADNAAFALAAMGEPGRPVAFAEAPHGYGGGSGFSAVPDEWKWALGTAVAAALAAMWAKGRRLGPAEQLERVLPPPRRAYVDAMASGLVRTRQPAEAMAPLQAAGLRRLARRAGLPPHAGADDLRAAARRAGLPDADVAALFVPAVTDHQVVAAGRALARLEGAET